MAKHKSTKNKREDILDATLKLTARKGFVGTSTANIAEEASVGMGTIYRYFKSKDQLFTALFNDLRLKFTDLLVSNYNFDNDAYSNFKNIVFVVVKYYIANPFEFKYLERYSDSSLKIDQKFNKTTLRLEPLKMVFESKAHGLKFKPLPFYILFAMVYQSSM